MKILVAFPCVFQFGRHPAWLKMIDRRILHAAALLLVSGCAERSDLGQVQGRVTMDGRPLSDASIEFSPTGPGSTAYGRSDHNGEYSVMFSSSVSGASLGANLVRISTYDISDDQGFLVPLTEIVPARYNVDSELVVNVEKGANQFNFELQSAGKIEQPIMGADSGAANLGTVRGTITLDGLPLKSATVTLLSKAENTPPAVGHTDEHGEYCVIYCCDTEGATIGKTTARISRTDSIGDPIAVELEVSVQPGPNRFDIELETQGGRIMVHLSDSSGTTSAKEKLADPKSP